ncbi:MAG: hypothetical protein OXD29_15930 [Roseovarius sp.]|nr:hypothetical protein [Roseovarius sp.]MCY4209422.1 hypothetical protein [Roseovarius sp.]MCY4291410.1 hypothetical protein [Roseovarius sp.]
MTFDKSRLQLKLHFQAVPEAHAPFWVKRGSAESRIWKTRLSRHYMEKGGHQFDLSALAIPDFPIRGTDGSHAV